MKAKSRAERQRSSQGQLILRILDLKPVECPLFYKYWQIPWNLLIQIKRPLYYISENVPTHTHTPKMHKN